MKSGHNIIVKKASGHDESFDIEKLRHSLRKSGASEELIFRITEDILNIFSGTTTTRQIYKRAYQLLHHHNRHHALKYRLKQSLLELGETGYPFEHLVGEIFRRQGYSVQVGQIIHGRCVSHEIDVIATNETEQIFIECKYSSNQGKHVGVQVPLYVHSRIEDIIFKRKEMPEYGKLSFSARVFTNTRFSDDATEYARCSGMLLTGWDIPSGQGLKDLIEKYRIFPVTIINQLNKKEKQLLLQKGIVSCSQLMKNPESLNELRLSEKKLKALFREIEDLKMNGFENLLNS